MADKKYPVLYATSIKGTIYRHCGVYNTIYFNIETKAMETIKLETFEYIDKNGEVKKDTETELKHYKDMLLILKKDRVQLKKDIRDFEEFEEDTTELKLQLETKESEIKETENTIEKLEV